MIAGNKFLCSKKYYLAILNNIIGMYTIFFKPHFDLEMKHIQGITTVQPYLIQHSPVMWNATPYIETFEGVKHLFLKVLDVLKWETDANSSVNVVSKIEKMVCETLSLISHPHIPVGNFSRLKGDSFIYNFGYTNSRSLLFLPIKNAFFYLPQPQVPTISSGTCSLVFFLLIVQWVRIESFPPG